MALDSRSFVLSARPIILFDACSFPGTQLLCTSALLFPQELPLPPQTCYPRRARKVLPRLLTLVLIWDVSHIFFMLSFLHHWIPPHHGHKDFRFCVLYSPFQRGTPSLHLHGSGGTIDRVKAYPVLFVDNVIEIALI